MTGQFGTPEGPRRRGRVARAVGRATAIAFLLLPAYAVPLFIRLRPEQEVTGTFKFRKVEVKQEGFDPAKVREPLYVLIDPARGYEPLTAELFGRIQKGEIRL